VAIVAAFIADREQDVAERYMLHSGIYRYRALGDYQRWAPQLGYERLPEDVVADITRERAELVKTFGREYDGDYGWAAEALGKRRPTFRDIEEAVDLNRWRPWYKLASQATHAGPHALEFDLGLLAGRRVMLSGPSNAGLADPGQSMCISLMLLTVTLLNYSPDAGDLVAMHVLMALADAASAAFLRAHEQLEREDQEEVTVEADDPVSTASRKSASPTPSSIRCT
jgi:hypothetical protein